MNHSQIFAEQHLFQKPAEGRKAIVMYTKIHWYLFIMASLI